MARTKMVFSEYRSYDLPPDFPLLVLDGDDWQISAARSANLHFHNCVEIGYCRKGLGKMILNRAEIGFQAGDVTLIGPQVHHTTWSDPDAPSLWSYLFVDLDGLLGQDIRQREALRHFADTGCLVLRQEEHSWASKLVDVIIREMRAREDGYRDCVRGLMLALAIRMMRQVSPEQARLPSPENPVLLPALAWFRDHYAEDFPMEALADLCHLSPTHFRRLFREQVGTNPLDYLHQVRISASCALLLGTRDSVASVANQVGYASLSCFNRHFLRIMGMIPSAWRRSEEAAPRPAVLSFTGWTRAETTEEILSRMSRRRAE